MARKNALIYPVSVIHAIEWDTHIYGNMIEFTDELGERHAAAAPYDPIISHYSAPKNRLHRWLLQPGTRCDITLPADAGQNIKISITEFADSQYIRGVYKNHEGKTEVRSLVPFRVRMEASKWHPLQWILTGWCKDRQAERSFALKDFDFRELGIAQFLAEQSDQFPAHPMDQREACADNPIIPERR